MPKRSYEQVVSSTFVNGPRGEQMASPLNVQVGREFIAVQACDICRQRKIRCDEDQPSCGDCRRNGIQCHYSERRMTKKDQSIQIAINSIRRLETKIGTLTDAVGSLSSPKTPSAAMSPGRSGSVSSPFQALTFDRPDERDDESEKLITFSQHGVLLWPAVHQSLPPDFLSALPSRPLSYVVELEQNREPLPYNVRPFPDGSGDHWLSKLPLGMIRGLADAFFATFNGLFPVLDRTYFFSFTLGSVLDKGFDYSIDATTVLVVLALGCLAVEGHMEGDFTLPRNGYSAISTGSTVDGFVAPEWYEVMQGEEHPGLRFFNEARRRIGFVNNSSSLPNCQLHLLCAFYNTQIIRPVDSYFLLHSAALCSVMELRCGKPIDFDSWEGDMQSRIYWCTLMYETILTQELGLPKSGLAQYESVVPLPKFTSFPGTIGQNRLGEKIDAFFHYHFLAQAAHRIMLTRISNSLYIYSNSPDWPSMRVAAELRHQLLQWKENLPTPLQFNDSVMKTRPSSPAHALAEALLKSRYHVAKFHIGRPYLYKALHNPSAVNEDDLKACHDCLENAMYWPMVTGICKAMKSCMLLKFGWCCQLFGQLILFYCVATSTNLRLRNALPTGWENWWLEMIEVLEFGASQSPAVAKDLELIRLLQFPAPNGPLHR